MNMVKTLYGNMTGVLHFDTYADGSVKEVELYEYNEVKTQYGVLIPSFIADGEAFERGKKRRSSIGFHPNGRIKTIALDKQTMILTPLGEFPAELLTFYEDGSLNRIFPLNGQIDGFWTEENEGELADSYTFQFCFGTFTTKVIGLRFYPEGDLKSLTLWPGEVVTLDTPVGELPIRIGFSLYKNGSLKSIEPFEPMYMNTPIGYIKPYDSEALGIHSDNNSLVFDESGNVIGLTTVANGVIVTGEDGGTQTFQPKEVESLVDITEMMIVPLMITFEEDRVIINDGKIFCFDRLNTRFRVFDSELASNNCCSSCSSCSGCGH